MQGEPMRAVELAGTIPALYQGLPPALTGTHRPEVLGLQYAGWTDEAWEAWVRSGGPAADPSMGAHLWLCGWLDERMGRREETRALLVRAQRAAPQEAGWALAAGLYELQAKDYERALRALNRARLIESRQPGSGGASLRGAIRFYRAAALERLGRWAEAEPELSAIAESEGSSVHEAQNYLAFALADRNLDLERADAMITRALTALPRSAAYLDTRGWIRFRQERFAEARSDLEAAVAEEPDDAEIRVHLAEVLERLGEDEAARREWQAAYVRDPDFSGLRIALAGRGIDPAPWAEERRAWVERWRWNFEPLLRGVDEGDFSVAAEPVPVEPEDTVPSGETP
jgi:tetratricopeptide (TPR) repeat protein